MLGGTTLSREKLKDSCAMLQKAFLSGKDDEISQAFEKFGSDVVEMIKQDYMECGNDEKILAARGYRQLTSDEKKFYQAVIQAGKNDDPKQAFANLPKPDQIMPETIIEDVYKDLIEEHPLLSKISFTNVKYLTKWILSDHTVQKAKWGKINSAITQEITSAFRVIEMTLCKLTAYAAVERDMLDLGPVFLDNYVRTILKEAIACALESGIISGNGLDCPIGLDRDIHEGVSFSTSTGYPKKDAVKINSFLPAEYGAVLAKLVKTEKGRMRKFDSVLLICNMEDYLTKVMPSTTALTVNGTYAKNLFPFPTDTCVSNELSTGKAILCLPEEYFMGLGSSKEGNIEYSDEAKFLEDLRLFKIKLYGMGRPFDNTISLVLDISDLEPAYILVKDMASAASAAS